MPSPTHPDLLKPATRRPIHTKNDDWIEVVVPDIILIRRSKVTRPVANDVRRNATETTDALEFVNIRDNEI
jgi:hypothetical protein